jgi:hypothetical protein
MPDGWNFPSAITRIPATFARLPSHLRTTSFTATWTRSTVFTTCGIAQLFSYSAIKMEILNNIFQKVLDHFKPNTLGKPHHSSSCDKAEDLLAFRTITTMLHFIQSHSSYYTGAIVTATEDRNDLRVLDALSAILIRQHKIVAVVAKPYDGPNLQVIASVICPTNTDSLLQPDALTTSFWRRFTVAPNPRKDKTKYMVILIL